MIRVRGLTKVFGLSEHRAGQLLNESDADQAVERAGGFTAVQDLSFDVQAGEIFVLMGLSGSGKSTVIRMLNRLVEPSSGQVLIDDVDILGLDGEELRMLRNERVNMVFQHFALLPHRTLLDNVAFGLKVRGVKSGQRTERAREALGQVGLAGWEESLPGELSGGMRQRVGLARVLATDADILLMDEPFSALDPLIRKEMQGLLLRLQEEFKKTIIFVTHDLNEAMLLGQRIMVMKSGQRIQLGSSLDLLTNPANDYVKQFTADVDRTRVLSAREVMQQPRVCVTEGEELEAVSHQISEKDCNASYVVNSSGQLRGVVARAGLDQAMASGASDLQSSLLSECCTVEATAPLADLFLKVGNDVVPVAVVDEDHQLLGVVPRTALLNALAMEDMEALNNA